MHEFLLDTHPLPALKPWAAWSPAAATSAAETKWVRMMLCERSVGVVTRRTLSDDVSRTTEPPHALLGEKKSLG